jgi:hypothetical protein
MSFSLHEGGFPQGAAHEPNGFMSDIAYDGSCEADLFEQRLQRAERGLKEDYRSSSDKR